MPARRALALLVFATASFLEIAAAQEFTKTEVGLQSSTLFQNRGQNKTDSGLGGRFTYNLTSILALEGEANYYLTRSTVFSAQADGRTNSAFFGPKAGIRGRRFGIFGKVRPGYLSFSNVVSSASVTSMSGNFTTTRKTHAALDIGGLFEIYPSQRLILRADVGEVLVRYGDATLFADPNGISVRTIGFIDAPLHLSIGASYRLGTLHRDEPSMPMPKHSQFGVHYSLQTLERVGSIVRDESAVGGWFTWELGRNFGLDSAASFFPRKMSFIGAQQGGRIFQALAGVRWGVRRDNYGLFIKLRPGIQTYTITEATNNRGGLGADSRFPAFTDLAFDMGGTFEIYTSRHTMLRFDAGETTIFFRERHVVDFSGSPFTAPSFSRPSVQLTIGCGLRF